MRDAAHRADLVGHRPAHGHRREQAHAVERAAVDEHLQQPVVVAGGGGHAGAAGKPLGRPGHVEPVEHPHVGVVRRRPRKACQRLALHMESSCRSSCSGSSTSSFRATSSGFLVTRSMMWPSRSVAIEYSNEVPGGNASGSVAELLQHLVGAHGVDAVDAELAVFGRAADSSGRRNR